MNQLSLKHLDIKKTAGKEQYFHPGLRTGYGFPFSRSRVLTGCHFEECEELAIIIVMYIIFLGQQIFAPKSNLIMSV